MQKYESGYELKDNEYLLKIRSEGEADATGFLSKLTKKGVIPVAFKDWGDAYNYKANLPIYVIQETFRSGWKLKKWRFGMSQNWASVIHPLGFSVEIYLSQFLDIVLNNTIVNGDIIGEFKWVDNELIKNI